MNEHILLELEGVKKMVEEIKQDRLRERAISEFKEAERQKWADRIKLILMAIPAVLSVIALIRTF